MSLVVITALAMVASIVLTFVRPFEYRTSFSLLIIQKQDLDGYTASKSAERISASLSQVMYTASFAQSVQDRVRQAGLTSTTLFYATDEQKQRDEWKRHIETRVLPDVGLLKVSVYHQDRASSAAIANALALVLVEQAPTYLGNDSVTLKTVDFPLTTKRPARPNVVINILGGMLLGFVGAFGYHWLVAQFATPLRRDDEVRVEHTPIAYHVPATPVEQPRPVVRTQHVPTEQPHTPSYTQFVQQQAPVKRQEPKPRYQTPRNLPVADDVMDVEPDLESTSFDRIADSPQAQMPDQWQMP